MQQLNFFISIAEIQLSGSIQHDDGVIIFRCIAEKFYSCFPNSASFIVISSSFTFLHKVTFPRKDVGLWFSQ